LGPVVIHSVFIKKGFCDLLKVVIAQKLSNLNFGLHIIDESGKENKRKET
jgi:hypothetical protein